MKTKKENYTIYGPQNEWDMNYHLLDNVKKIEYLIDIDDVTDNKNDQDGGLFIETLWGLKDIDTILSYAWKENPTY